MNSTKERSDSYPGLMSIARQYWGLYSYSVIGFAVVLLFTGAIGALVVLMIQPPSLWYFALAAVSLVLHFAALFVRDVREGEYEPSQTTFSSGVQLLALVIIIGTFFSTILLVGTFTAYAVDAMIGSPTFIGAGIAAYYPVLDLVLIRRGRYTPGTIAITIVVTSINTIINIHQSILETVPVVGKHRRPQS